MQNFALRCHDRPFREGIVLEELADAMRISPALDPAFLTALDSLDRGVFAGPEDWADASEPPPLSTLLVMPPAQPLRRRRRRVSVASPGSRGLMSIWAASWIAMAVCLGASAAAFTFHVQLSNLISRWEQPPARQVPASTSPKGLRAIEIARADH